MQVYGNIEQVWEGGAVQPLFNRFSVKYVCGFIIYVITLAVNSRYNLFSGEGGGHWGRWVITESADSKTEDVVALGWGRVTLCLTVTWLLSVQWLLNLRGVEAWTPAGPPPPRLDTFHLVSVCSTQREEKGCTAEKERKASLRLLPSCQPGVRGQRSTTEEVCQVLSGADKPT